MIGLPITATLLKPAERVFSIQQGVVSAKIRIRQREKENTRQKKIWLICSKLLLN